MEKVEINSVIEDYVEHGLGVEPIAKKYHIGKLKVKAILKENGIEMKKKGKQPLKDDFVVKDYHIQKYIPRDGYHFFVIDKNNEEFGSKDYANLAGVLTTYIKNHYGVEIPTLYDRRLYYMRTGNYWWEQWLTVTEVRDNEVKKCPYCDWETSDIHNKSGAFEVHLLKAHGISKMEYIEEHPDEKDYFRLVHPSLDLQFEDDPHKFVVCQVCGKKFKRIPISHIQSHGMTREQYLKKYGINSIVSIDYHEKLQKHSREVNESMTHSFSSKAEKEIMDYITTLGFECRSDRHILHGRELDIYIPSKNFAIEYNGNVWHTEQFKKGWDYHYKKMMECKEQGVSLIQVCDDEFNEHPGTVLDEIRHLLGCNDTDIAKVGEYTIKEIPREVANCFLYAHHLMGPTHSSVFLSAQNSSHTICVMAFRRQKENGHWILTRAAFANGVVYREIARDMFNWFIEHYQPIEVWAYADRRWTPNETDNTYTMMGMQFDKATRPDYKYFNRRMKNKRINRMGFTKKSLVEKYKFDENMPLHEMIERLGYTKIWDCGLFKYVWKNQQIEEEVKEDA